jgi:signal transduction histidine kinase
VLKMLALARLDQRTENNSSQAVLISSSLRDAIGNSVNHIKAFAELKGIDVQIECAVEARVPIDNHDAFLLCSNILLNAVQHSPNGSTVRVAVAVDQDTVQLTVKDQGKGVSDQDRLHIFEPFYRGDPSRSRISGSTGLGLSICKAICGRAGGAIEIANNISGGALVTVRLPPEFLGNDSALSGSLKAQ